MRLTVNGEPHDWTPAPGAPCLQSLLASLGAGERKVAVVVNEDVVPASQWASFVIREGDRVEILIYAGGG